MTERDSLDSRLARDNAEFAEYTPDYIHDEIQKRAAHEYKPELLKKIGAYQFAAMERDLLVFTAERTLRERVEETREEPSAYEEHADAVEASRRITHLVDESLNKLIDESSDKQPRN